MYRSIAPCRCNDPLMVDPHCRKCRTAYNSVSDALGPLTNCDRRTQYNRDTSDIDAGGMIAWLSNAQY